MERSGGDWQERNGEEWIREDRTGLAGLESMGAERMERKGVDWQGR